jgi:hypothetical protein
LSDICTRQRDSQQNRNGSQPPKIKQYASWLGLSIDAVQQHFPESDKTHKGHGRKTPSGLRSTKPKENKTIDRDDDFQFNNPEDTLL